MITHEDIVFLGISPEELAIYTEVELAELLKIERANELARTEDEAKEEMWRRREEYSEMHDIEAPFGWDGIHRDDDGIDWGAIGPP